MSCVHFLFGYSLWTLQVLALTLTNSLEAPEVTYCFYSSHKINTDRTNVVQVIADNVGDNVGEIAGMGSDLFESYAESSCAALYVAHIILWYQPCPIP